MFGIFKRKDDKGIIKIKVTKTSHQAQYEKEITSQAEQKQRMCPECSFDNKNSLLPLGYVCDDGSRGYFGKCSKCGTEWDVNYII